MKSTAKIPAALGLFLLMWGLALGSMLNKSPTFDEGFYIARGWAYFQTGAIFPLGHPPLTNMISGLGVLLEPNLPNPTTLTGWSIGEADFISEDLLWGHGVNVERVTLLARLPQVMVGLLFGAVVFRWGEDRYRAGLLPLALFALSPGVLAHTRLAGTDIGVAAFYVATLWAWWRYMRQPSPRWLIASGVLFGLAQASKFSALILIPTLGLMMLPLLLRREKSLLEGMGALFAMGGIGVGVLWALYGFTLRPMSTGMYGGELLHFFDLAAGGHKGYLLGRFSEEGWWYYHLVTLGVKLTEPALLLIVAALASMAVRRMTRDEWLILFPAVFYIGITLLITLNVGVRYLLPAVPLLFVFAGRLVEPLRKAGAGLLLPLLAGLHVLIAMVAYPHYIPYFNLVSGGPANGWRILADSNVDWGQDLPLLARYMEQEGLESVYLSYFGQARPGYYGIGWEPLPAWPPTEQQPRFDPLRPEAGVYAISVSNLVGVQMIEPEALGYFRIRQPEAHLGHSILIYEVAEAPPPADRVLLCADDPATTEARITELLGGAPQIAYRACPTSMIAPAWVLLPPEQEPLIDGEHIFTERYPDGRPRWAVWRVQGVEGQPVAEVGGLLGLLGAHIEPQQAAPGDSVTVTVTWRVLDDPPAAPLSIFAHLTAPDGFVRATGDALGIPLSTWQVGDTLVQQHTFTMPEGDQQQVWVGLYDTATGERLPVSGEGADNERRHIDLGDVINILTQR